MSEPGTAKTLLCDYCGRVYPWHQCMVEVMSEADEAEALAELERVTAAHPAVLVYPTGDPDTCASWYCGTFEWRTAGGWTIRVYNDCAEWDYLETIIAPDGRSWQFPFWTSNEPASATWHAMTERLKEWKPSDESGWPGIDSCPP